MTGAREPLRGAWGRVEKDLDMEEINWMMGSGMYIHIGANVRAYWQKSNKDVHSGKMYILIEGYWTMYIYRMYPLCMGETGGVVIS